jgi:hypothetical protein
MSTRFIDITWGLGWVQGPVDKSVACLCVRHHDWKCSADLPNTFSKSLLANTKAFLIIRIPVISTVQVIFS